jgi:hypothetical protein
MSQSALERRDFPVPMRWPHTGSDISRPGQRGRRAVLSLIRFKRLLRGLLYTSNLANRRIRRPHPVGITSTLKPRAYQIPIAPAAPPVPTSSDFVPWCFLDAARKRAWKGSSCRRPKTCTRAEMGRPIRSPRRRGQEASAAQSGPAFSSSSCS